MAVPTVALSFEMTVAHVSAEPFQVPRLKPMVTVESGARLTMVARIGPELVTLKGCVLAPFCVSVPTNVSVTGLTGCDGIAGLMSSRARHVHERYRQNDRGEKLRGHGLR